MSTFAELILAVVLPPASSWFWCGFRIFRPLRFLAPPRFLAGWLSSAVVGIAVGAMERDWRWATGAAISTAVAILVWWYRRRKGRKRAAQLLGAKSRALRDGLVRRMRESAKPGPVLRPAPGGARR